MTPTQRKQAQLKLEVLYQRKAKADAMGPDVIQAHRAAYDQICADIAELEDALALDAGGGAASPDRGLPGGHCGHTPGGY